MKQKRGFTLIELMIVVLVIALLAGLALSAYNKQVRKSRRAEAKQVLSDFSLREEKYRSNNLNYATCDALLAPATTCANYNSTAIAYYSVAITFPSTGTCPSTLAKDNKNSFILTATAKTGTDQTKDSGCTSMMLTNDCGTVSKTPAQCW